MVWGCLKRRIEGVKIMDGDVEAESQSGALKVLSERLKVSPHTGEVLEIFDPPDLENEGKDLPALI